jgi:hypothetical protein
MRPLTPGCYAPRRQLQHTRLLVAGRPTLTLCLSLTISIICPGRHGRWAAGRHEVCAPHKPRGRKHMWQTSTARLQARTMFANAAARSASNLRGLLSATHLPVGRAQVQHGVITDSVDSGSGLNTSGFKARLCAVLRPQLARCSCTTPLRQGRLEACTSSQGRGMLARARTACRCGGCWRR